MNPKKYSQQDERDLLRRVGSLLWDSRKRLGLTQLQVSKKLKISTQQFNSYECGRVMVAAKYVEAIQKFLEIEKDQLVELLNLYHMEKLHSRRSW